MTPHPSTCRSPVTSRDSILRISSLTATHAIPTSDLLAVEEPLEIRVNTQSVSVTMRTPGHDDELAIGFLLTEGILRSPADLAEVAPCRTPAGANASNLLNATLAPGINAHFEALTRHVFASSSCGLCGKASISNIHLQFPPLPPDSLQVPLRTLESLPAVLREAQHSFEQTGGLHAAALFDSSGALLIAREDIGRHNAVDKVLGRAFLDNLLPLNSHILLVSGRVSFEILQKALAARIPLIAAVSAPSSLAVDFARANLQTLAAFLRPPSVNIYSHPQRLVHPLLLPISPSPPA